MRGFLCGDHLRKSQRINHQGCNLEMTVSMLICRRGKGLVNRLLGVLLQDWKQCLDFIFRPQSKIDPNEVRARAKQIVQDRRHMEVLDNLPHDQVYSENQVYVTGQSYRSCIDRLQDPLIERCLEIMDLDSGK